ncbi:Coronin-7 [Gonapodya sp. JEL0774]|nr:Coronin-7 [Gonapodya sp. JEL0774]
MKFRNVTPTTPKREEFYSFPSANAISAGPSDSSNGLATDGVVFAARSNSGTQIFLLPLDIATTTRRLDSLPLALSVPSPVTDFAISPLLASSANTTSILLAGADDGSLRTFALPTPPPSSEPPSLLSPDALSLLPSPTPIPSAHTTARRVECLAFHPSAAGLAVSASGPEIKVWDLENAKDVCAWNGHGDTVVALGWNPDGSLLATTARDTMLRIFDPRAPTDALATSAHQGTKPSRVTWLGSGGYLATAGTGKRGGKEVKLWDSRALSAPIVDHELAGGAGGVSCLMWDEDTGMVWIGGRGSPTITWLDLHPSRAPFLTTGITQFSHSSPLSTFCSVPKLSLDHLGCEIHRTLAGTADGSAVVPVRWIVPRRRYGDWVDELFPETRGWKEGVGKEEWIKSGNGEVGKVGVQEAAREWKERRVGANRSSPASATVTVTAPVTGSVASPPSPLLARTSSSAAPAAVPNTSSVSSQAPIPTSTPTYSSSSTVSTSSTTSAAPISAATTRPPTAASLAVSAKFSALRTSPFRFILGKPIPAFHPAPNLPPSFPADSDYLAYAKPWLVMPVSGPGGKIVVVKGVQEGFGRLPPVPVGLVNGGDVASVAVDESRVGRVICGGEDGKIRVWDIPENGVKEDMYTPTTLISAHDSRVNLLLFHPVAQDLLISASPERGEASIKVWDLASGGGKEAKRIEHHREPIFAMTWSPDGTKVATVSKDKKIRVVDPRSGKLLGQADCAEGGKGGRVVWVGERIFVIGFGKGSLRQIEVHHSSTLTKLATVPIDVSPSLLSAQFDPDTNLLYLAGRGESAVRIWEVSQEEPYAKDLSRFETGQLQQGFALSRKEECDVRGIEVNKAWRLTSAGIELVSFKVPRTRDEFFQDDLFPPTTDRTTSTFTAAAWLGGANADLPKISLKPSDMIALSEAPAATRSPPSKRALPTERILTDDEKREQMMANMLKIAREVDDKPVQKKDDIERDDSEWD